MKSTVGKLMLVLLVTLLASGCAQKWTRAVDMDDALVTYPKLWPYGDEANSPLQQSTVDLVTELSILSSNVYAKNEDKDDFKLPDPWVWDLADWQDGKTIKSESGLAYRIYEKRENGHTSIAIVFRGTHFLSWGDLMTNTSLYHKLGLKDQYWYAREEIKEIFEKYYPGAFCSPDYTVIATGHSLGGGLASSMSLSFPCVVTIAFNSSPVKRINAMEKPYNLAPYLYLHEGGDPLELSNKFKGFGNLAYATVETTKQVNCISAHGIVNLALGLMSCSESPRPDFKEIYDGYVAKKKLKNLIDIRSTEPRDDYSGCLEESWHKTQFLGVEKPE